MINITIERKHVYLLAVIVVVAALLVPVTAWASNRFNDVSDGNIFHDDITWLADAGVTFGCGDGKYCPDDFVTREQMAALIHRLSGSDDRTLDGRLDALEAWRTPAVSVLPIRDCLDLETGSIIDLDDSDCPGSTWDFFVAHNSTSTPNAVIVQNETTGAELAYSSESFDNVTPSDISSLTFSAAFVDVSFSQVAVIKTSDGNYFKLGFISETGSEVTFQWLPL